MAYIFIQSESTCLEQIGYLNLIIVPKLQLKEGSAFASISEMLFAGRSHTNDRFTRQPETVQGVLKTLSKTDDAKDKSKRAKALSLLLKLPAQMLLDDLESKYELHDKTRK